MGRHEAGLGPGDADIICSAMNLPIPVGYWSTQGNFCAVEELVGKAQLETTALGMQEACDADKIHYFQWWNSLPVTELMYVLNMLQITITYDMGWQ